MSITNGYLSREELEDTLGIDGRVTASQQDCETAIEAASRWIDARCSDPRTGRIRHFYLEDAPTARLYRAESLHLVCTSDFDDPDSVTVETDPAGDGSWVTLSSGAWQAEPLVRLDGHPYTQITAASYSTTFPLGLNPRIRVTARWGWAVVPPPVKQACQILSVAYLQGKMVVSMHDGYDIDSTGPTNPVAMAEHLLKPYLPVPIPDPALPPNYTPLP